jgi:predicted CoA-binding protein
MKQERVAILGASDKPDRYSNKAQRLLRQHGHTVVPVHPALKQIEGIDVAPSLDAIEGPVDTLTLYVGPAISSSVAEKVVALKPGRVIFNPGTENPELQTKLSTAGIPWEEACTLVLLNTGQY